MVGLIERPNINLVNIVNPFDAINSREFHSIPANVSLKECIDLVRSPYDNCFYVAAINGEIVPQDFDYSLIYPKGNVVLCAVPQGGGGGGKNTGRMILQLVVTIVAAVATWYVGGAGGWIVGAGNAATWGSLAVGSAVGMAISVAGNLLINALCPLDTEKEKSESATYSWDAPANINKEGVVWPVLYGTMRITPPILAKYIEVVDDKQYLNVLYAIADHAITSIDNTSMLINGNSVVKNADADNFIDWEVRYGTTNQKPLQYFNDTRTTKACGVVLPKIADYDDDESYVVGNKVSHSDQAWECIQNCSDVTPEEGAYWTACENDWVTVDADGAAIEGLGIAFSFPYGLYHTHNDGGLSTEEVDIEVQYKKVGDVVWTAISTYEATDQVVTEARWVAGYWHHDDWTTLEEGSTDPNAYEEGEIYAGKPYVYINDGHDRMRHEWHWVAVDDTVQNADTLVNNYISFSEERTTAMRRVFYVDRIPAGEYQVRARYANGVCPSNSTRHFNVVYFDYVESIIYDDFSYPGSSLLALRALATDKLSGGMPIVSFIATRSTVQVWNGSAYVSKSASNPAWASYDVLHNARYGGGISYSKMIYADFLAWANNCDTHYMTTGVASSVSFKCNLYIDEAFNLRETLNMIGALGRGNTVQQGSYFTCFIDKLEDTPTQSFLFNVSNIAAKSFQLEYMPMVDRANAVDVTYWDKDDDYKQKTLEIHAIDFDSMTTEVKKSQVTLRGCTSREEALCHGNFALNCNRLQTITATFDTDIDALACMPWDVIEVQHDVTLWGDGGRVLSASASTIVVDKTITLLPETTYTLKTQTIIDDVIHEYTLATVGDITETSSLGIVGTFDTVPVLHDKWVLTSSDSLTKSFRLIRTTRAGDLTRKLICLEYNPDIYVDNGTLEPPEEPEEPTYESHLKAVEVQQWNGSPDTDIHLSWTGFATAWYVFYKISTSSRYIYAGTTSTPFYRIDKLPPGSSNYTFCVSHTTNPEDGITVSLTVTGHAIAAKPTTPEGLTAYLIGQTIVLSWTKPADVTIIGHTIYLNGTAVITNYNGNQYVYSGLLTAGTYNFTLCAVTRGGESAPTASASITVEVPDTPSLTIDTVGELAVLSWADCTTSLPIAYYTVNGVAINAQTYSERVDWSGSKEFSVSATDVCGNSSSTATTSLSIIEGTTPTGIVATGLTYAIKLEITYVDFVGFSCIEIWASDTNNREDAIKVGESLSPVWTHSGLDLIDIKYYWVRTKDIFGNLGDWYATSATGGTVGQTSTDPEDYLTILTGNISEDELTSTLNGRIDWIDQQTFVVEDDLFEEDDIITGMAGAYSGLFDLALSHKENIDTLLEFASSAANDITAMMGEIAGLTTSPWSATGSYVIGNYVTYDEKVYRCIQAYSYPTVKTPGSDVAYWEEFDSVITLLTEVETRVDTLEGQIINTVTMATFNALDNRVSLAESTIDQHSGDIALRVLQTDFDAFTNLFLPDFDTASSYATNDYVMYEGDSYKCIKTIDFTPAPLPTDAEYWEESPFSDQFVALMNELEIATDSISLYSTAIIGDIALLSSETIVEDGVVVFDIGDIIGVDCRISEAAIDIMGIESSISLHTSLIEGLTGRISTAEIDIDAAEGLILLKAAKTDLDDAVSNIAAIGIMVDENSASIESHAASISSLNSSMSTAQEDITAGQEGTWASILGKLATTSYETDQEDANGYLRVAALENRLEVYDTNSAPTYSAATTYSPGDIVLYSTKFYRCIKTALNKTPGTPSVYWTEITAGLLSQYTVKLNVNNRVAGFGLMLSDSTPSEFVIVAEKFMVVNNSDTLAPKAVFTVGTIEGNTAVGINGDLILDGSIIADSLAADEIYIKYTAQIKDATITSAKITDLSATKLTSGTITSQTITLAGSNSYIACGKTKFDNTEEGFILGLSGTTPKFYIGDTSSYLNWNGTTLTVVGDIKTGTTGERLEFLSSTNKFYFYNSGGVAELIIGASETSGYQVMVYAAEATEGVAANVSPFYINLGGSCNCNAADRYTYPLKGLNYTTKSAGANDLINCGARFYAVNGDYNYGVYADTHDAGGTYCYGVWAHGGTAPIVLDPALSASAPSHAALKGSLFVTSAGVLYINTNGSTTWKKVADQ